MDKNNKLLKLIVILLVVLFLRDVPYLNILVISKVWIAYILLIVFIFPPKKIIHLIHIALIFLFIFFVLTLIKFTEAVEDFGVIIYLILLTAVVSKTYFLIKSSQKDV